MFMITHFLHILVIIISLLFLIEHFHQLNALKIPQDVEILHGYEFDDSDEYYPTEAEYYEARHFIKGLKKSVRNKRSMQDNKDKVKNSPPDVAVAAPKAVEKFGESIESMDKRQLESNIANRQVETNERKIRIDEKEDLEYLPKAERQIMDPDYDYYSQRHISAWSDTTNQKIATDSETTGSLRNKEKNNDSGDNNDDGGDGRVIGDIQGQATNNFIGRRRQARVNFVTQPQKDVNVNDDEITDGRTPARIPLPKLPFYEGKYRLAFPWYDYEVSPSRSYAPYLRRYDRFDEQYSRFDPHSSEDHYLYRRHYDPYDSYSPRIPRYPEPYYNYPDQRYDIPEPRDYATPIQNNDLYDHEISSYLPLKNSNNYRLSNNYPKHPIYLPPDDPSPKYRTDYQPLGSSPKSYRSYPRNQRRIIYYAHLPEIVRTPYNSPARYNRERDRDYGIDDVSRAMNRNKTNKESGKPSIDGGKSMVGSAPGSSGVDHGSYEYTKHDKNMYPTPKTN